MGTGGPSDGGSGCRRRRRLAGAVQLLMLVAAAWMSVATKQAPTRYCHIRQANTVPLPAPSLRPPRRTGSYVEAGLSSHTSVWATASSKYAGQQRNLYSTREQLGGYVVLSWHRRFSLGASFELAIPSGEQKLLGGELQAPELPNGGGGLQLAGHFKLSERLRLDWVNDIWLYGVVAQLGFQYARDENGSLVCPPLVSPASSRWRQPYITFVLRTQLTLGIAFGRTQLVVAVGARNVPHHIKGRTAIWTDDSPLDWRDAFSIYPYVFAGAQVRLAKGWSLIAGLVQPLYFDPIVFVPLLSVGIQYQPTARAWPGG
jgi:hypothetical protein